MSRRETGIGKEGRGGGGKGYGQGVSAGHSAMVCGRHAHSRRRYSSIRPGVVTHCVGPQRRRARPGGRNRHPPSPAHIASAWVGLWVTFHRRPVCTKPWSTTGLRQGSASHHVAISQCWRLMSASSMNRCSVQTIQKNGGNGSGTAPNIRHATGEQLVAAGWQTRNGSSGF